MQELTKCSGCGATLHKDEISLSKKLLGIQAQEGYCLDCLATSTQTTVAQLQQDIARYKEEGCLFFM